MQSVTIRCRRWFGRCPWSRTAWKSVCDSTVRSNGPRSAQSSQAQRRTYAQLSALRLDSVLELERFLFGHMIGASLKRVQVNGKTGNRIDLMLFSLMQQGMVTLLRSCGWDADHKRTGSMEQQEGLMGCEGGNLDVL